jgi:hypothetical protein
LPDPLRIETSFAPSRLPCREAGGPKTLTAAVVRPHRTLGGANDCAALAESSGRERMLGQYRKFSVQSDATQLPPRPIALDLNPKYE